MTRAAKVLDAAVIRASYQGYHERHSVRRESKPGDFVKMLQAQHGADVFADLKAEDIVEPAPWWLQVLLANET